MYEPEFSCPKFDLLLEIVDDIETLVLREPEDFSEERFHAYIQEMREGVETCRTANSDIRTWGQIGWQDRVEFEAERDTLQEQVEELEREREDLLAQVQSLEQELDDVTA